MNQSRVSPRTPRVHQPCFNLQDSYEQKGLDFQRRCVSSSAAATGLKSGNPISKSILTLTMSILSQRQRNMLVPALLTQAQVKPN